SASRIASSPRASCSLAVYGLSPARSIRPGVLARPNRLFSGALAQIRRDRLVRQRGDGRVERDDALLLAAETADRDLALLGLTLADDEQYRDLAQRVLADLVVDLLVAQVAVDAQAGGAKLRDDVERVGVGVRHDRAHHHLQRRKPQRKMAGEVLDQDAGEALERAEDRAVDHHRRLF